MELGTCLDQKVLLQFDDQILLKLFLLWLIQNSEQFLLVTGLCFQDV